MLTHGKPSKLTNRLSWIQLVCIISLLCDTANFFVSSPLLLIVPKLTLLVLIAISTNALYLQLFSFLLILLTMLQSFENIELVNLISNFSFAIKTILFLYSIEYLISKRLCLSSNGLKIVYGYILFNIALTWIDIGLTNYGRLPSGIPIGSKGIYQSGNEFGIAAFFIIMLSIFYVRPSLRNDAVMFIVGIGIATKVALVGSTFVFLNRIKLIVKRLHLIGLIFVIIFLSYIVVPYLFDYLTVRFSYDLKNAESILAFVLSGRTARIEQSYHEFLSSDIINLLFGHSFSCIVSEQCTSVNFVENDFVDYLFIYGIFIFILIVLISCNLLYRSLKKDKFLFLSLILLFGVSFTGGHVLYNALFPTLLLLTLHKKEA